MTRGRVSTFCVLALALSASVSGSALGDLHASSASPSAAAGALTFTRGTATSQPSIWIAAADGSDAKPFVSGGESASIAPDGDYVDVTTSLGGNSPSLDLYQSSDGKLAGGFFSAKLDSALPLAWSSDSRYLAVELLDNSKPGKGALDVIDTSTMRARTVATGVIYGASFDPAGDEIAYAVASSESPDSAVNIYSDPVAGGARSQLTTDGRSLNPLYVKGGLLFDHETLRGRNANPSYQLWLKSGLAVRQLTHMKIPSLIGGLVPQEASADGNHILAGYQGEDTDNAWAVQLSPLRLRQIDVNGQPVQGAAISSDGQQLLIDIGGFEQPADRGTVESIPFSGGKPTKLTRGASPSWNR